jgi:hypothetical protein
MQRIVVVVRRRPYLFPPRIEQAGEIWGRFSDDRLRCGAAECALELFPLFLSQAPKFCFVGRHNAGDNSDNSELRKVCPPGIVARSNDGNRQKDEERSRI